MSKSIRIAIVGSGVAGMTALHYLNSKLKSDKNVEFFLIDPNPNFVFTPRLTELITGVTKEKYMIKPKSIFKDHEPIHVIKASAKEINLNSKQITVDRIISKLNLKKGQIIDYDYLLLAQGASTNFWGIKGAKKFCFPYKEYPDAQKLKLEIFSHLNSESDEDLNITIAGAGPTGVELAFSITDAIKAANKQRKKEGKSLKENIKVHIVDSGEFMLKKLPSYFQKKSTSLANKKKIFFHSKERVKEVHRAHVDLVSGKKVSSQICIWTAGVTPNVILTVPNVVEDSGHIRVQRSMQVYPLKFPEVFAAGDCTLLEDISKKKSSKKKKNGGKMESVRVRKTYYPPTAQVASRQAEFASENMFVMIKNKKLGLNVPIKLKEFNYKSKGWFVELGTKMALAQAGPIFFKEPVAWHARDKYYKYFFWKLMNGY